MGGISLVYWAILEGGTSLVGGARADGWVALEARGGGT